MTVKKAKTDSLANLHSAATTLLIGRAGGVIALPARSLASGKLVLAACGVLGLLVCPLRRAKIVSQLRLPRPESR